MKIIFPKNLTSIGYGSFENCMSLEDIIFPESLLSIDDKSFCYCKRLKKITYHENTEEILKEYFLDEWDRFEKTIVY